MLLKHGWLCIGEAPFLDSNPNSANGIEDSRAHGWNLDVHIPAQDEYRHGQDNSTMNRERQI